MKVPFLDLKLQYKGLMGEITPRLADIFENTAFIGGNYVQKFEKEMADYLGVKHAIGCGNGTEALVLALRACNVQPGDEVITTPFTFFATAESIASVGAVPVFVDVKQDDYNIDPAKIEEAITDKTKVILPVHIFGAPCDMDAIMDIARRHNLKVIEDDAQAVGSSYKGKKAGTLGDIGCFSFYPTKNLGGAGDGGMVTTNDEKLAVILRAFREHGAGQNGAKAYEFLGGINEEVKMTEKATDLYNPYKYFNYLIGYNSRLDAIQAAVLSVKLQYLDTYNARRTEVAEKYMKGLCDKITKPVYASDTVPCWHQFVIRSDYKQELSSYLAENEIGSGTFYPVPLHKQKAFNTNNCKNSDVCLPVAEEISSQSVCLPIFPEITDEQVEYVIETINKFYEQSGDM